MSNLTRCPICKGVALHRPRCTEEITEANEQTPVKTYQRMEQIAREALATTEPEDV